MSMGLIADPPIVGGLAVATAPRACREPRAIAQAIFDLIDVKHDGLVTLARLLAALQNCGAGSRAKLQGEELTQKVVADIHDNLFTVNKLAEDLHTEVREGLSWDANCIDIGFPSTPKDSRAESVSSPSPSRSPSPGAAHPAAASPVSVFTPASASPALRGGTQRRAMSSPGFRTVDAPEKVATAPSAGRGVVGTLDANAEDAAPKLKVMAAEELSGYVVGASPKKDDKQTPSQLAVVGAQTSFNNVWDQVSKSPGQQHRSRLKKDLHSYFQDAALFLSQDVPLYQGMQPSRFQHYQEQRKYDEALKPGYLKVAQS